METHRIIEIAFKGAAAHYEIAWQEILTERHDTKLPKQMIVHALNAYMPREDIAELLGLSYRTITQYRAQADRLYKCYGSFYNTIRNIRKQFRELI